MYTVYIVDDKKLIRESLARTVDWEGKGFQVVGMAGDAFAAEEGIRKLRPDVVISDIRMPGRDGFELTREVYKILPDVKVIIITGYDKFEYARESLKLGAVDVILKPIRNSDLESTLTQIYNQLGEKKTVSSEAVSGVGANPAPDKTGETMGHLTRAVVNYIDQNYAAEISLGALAEMYRVTPSHLSKVFKKEKGLTFLRYLNQIRMDHASQMLLDPKYRISEIAESCGFHSPLQFTKVFKEFYGKTPRDFRRR